jgi:hypothetical protein
METKKCGMCGKDIHSRNLCDSCRAKQYRAHKSNSVCKVDGCSNIVKAKNMCNSHLKQHNSIIKGEYCRKCDEYVFASGLCRHHYNRKYNGTDI